MVRIRRIATFWYNFVVGDDWRLPAAVIVALAVAFGLGKAQGIPTWWVLPAAIVLVFPYSLWRAVRHGA